ncbi:MAG: hypothetical protein LBT97_03240 [Planctomycetota bacterium]|jgi:hypothetical protein|nr:hypothetical protein [Planctomycetota bacterium]
MNDESDVMCDLFDLACTQPHAAAASVEQLVSCSGISGLTYTWLSPVFATVDDAVLNSVVKNTHDAVLAGTLDIIDIITAQTREEGA